MNIKLMRSRKDEDARCRSHVSGGSLLKIRHHRYAHLYSVALLFVLPLTLPIVELQYSAPLVCAAAAFAAIQEGHFFREASNHE